MSNKLSDFDYNLPQNLIAQQPTSPRDSARLLVLNKKNNKISHHKFFEIDKFLNKGDIIVLNNTKVIPARLYGKKETGGKVEILLLNQIPVGKIHEFRLHKKIFWSCLTKPGLKPNTKIIFNKQVNAKVISREKEKTTLEFNLTNKQFNQFLKKSGNVPLPPYITPRQSKKTKKQYQTIFAKYDGSVAAPTAGLHFTKRLIKKLKDKGIKFEYITLHVGLGTFQPVKEKNILKHKIHSEYAEISKTTAKNLNQAKKNGHRIIACGTTVVRTLETATTDEKTIKQLNKKTSIYITPGYKFKFVDAMITNFHLPKSTLLMLISAFSSLPQIKQAYQIAIKNKYKFYSFGDAMFIK
ncbi:MAG: tRNA preQ1(34) S-adenosylmethionine ribosyltransferase-isomerase QueA [Patescibacteria group bacterium]|nr:tRNA preQ1(34) S-adenosylmethionine ribosyltransferase-isomerase QueA [Patescibacteria group bacterium]